MNMQQPPFGDMGNLPQFGMPGGQPQNFGQLPFDANFPGQPGQQIQPAQSADQLQQFGPAQPGVPQFGGPLQQQFQQAQQQFAPQAPAFDPNQQQFAPQPQQQLPVPPPFQGGPVQSAPGPVADEAPKKGGRGKKKTTTDCTATPPTIASTASGLVSITIKVDPAQLAAILGLE